jgi:hypothetical protein
MEEGLSDVETTEFGEEEIERGEPDKSWWGISV